MLREQTSQPSRIALVSAYQIVGFLVSVVAVTLSTQFRNGYDAVAQELGGMLVLIPIGWLIFSLTHFSGWIFWIGCLAAVTFRRRWMLAMAVVGAALFGSLWPAAYFRMMSV